MSIDLTTLITNLQADIDAVDSSTSMSSILSLMHKARKITGISNYYDSAGLLPVDSSYDGMLAFSKADNTVYKFVDSGLNSGTVQGWHKADSAFSSGGASGPIAYAGTNVYVYHDDLQKFDMTSSTNAAVVIYGPYFPANQQSSGGRSSTHGYFAGGGPTPSIDTIMSFPFAAEDAISDTTANLTTSRYGSQGVPIGDGLFNYAAGGLTGGGSINVIEKYPTANANDATDVGDLTDQRYGVGGGTSSTHGYRAGGTNPGSQATNIIDKWPFATDENATDVGDLTQQRGWGAAASSTDHGYYAGGFHWIPPSGRYNIIDKYAFASDGNASDVGDLTGTDHNNSGGSSSTHGFRLGGSAGTPTGSTDIEKFAFASDGNATDVADLTENVKNAGSTHDTA